MQRYAIIDTAAGKVINVVEYEAAPSNPPPGFEAGIIAVQDDMAGPGWTWNGTALEPPAMPAPASKPQTVLPQDLMAQFTPADMTKIMAAISADATGQKALLWYAMIAQRDPMELKNARFQAGWNALIGALGSDRMNAIAAALGISMPSS
jgi:hypothetical protein